MGFRFIKRNTEEYQSKLEKLKLEKLEQETHIWQNITHEKENIASFISRFRDIKIHLQYPNFQEDKLKKLQKKIRSKEVKLFNVQGNMNIDNAKELLD